MMFSLPPVVKNLLIINGIFYLASLTYPEYMYEHFALFHPYSDYFYPHQFATHMFMHDVSGFAHIFGNMFALFIFGGPLENAWGSKRFLIFYLLTGLGAAALHMTVRHLEIVNVLGTLNPMEAQQVLNMPTLGASGAVFGILLGFGMMYPNIPIYIYFLFPIKAKYLVALYGAFELFAVLSNQSDGIAHYAHLGGMLFGFVLIKYWGLRRIR